MAALYGTLVGNRGEVTRMGSANSGIRASVQSWNGSLITRLDLDEESKPVVSIAVAAGSSSAGEEVFKGSLEEFKEMCKNFRLTQRN